MVLDLCSPSRETRTAMVQEKVQEKHRPSAAELSKPDTQENSFMAILQNYCQPKRIVAMEQVGRTAPAPEESGRGAGAEPRPPSYDSIFSTKSGILRSGSKSSAKPPQRYSWDEQAEQLKEHRRQMLEEDAHGNLVAKVPKKPPPASSQVEQFEKLRRTVSTEETERARARRAAKADAERKAKEERAMRHSGDYRVKHIKSSTTPAATGIKTVVEGKTLSPFHSLMENLRLGLGGQP